MKTLRYILILFLLWTGVAFATDYTIGSGQDFDPVNAANIEACAAGLVNGENCIIDNGNYTDLGNITIDDARTAATYIKAETAGGVTFSGTIRFYVTGDYWVFSGFNFTGLDLSGDYAQFDLSGDNNRIADNKWHDTGNTTNGGIYAVIARKTADNLEFDHNTIIDSTIQGFGAYSYADDYAVAPHVHHNYFKNISGLDELPTCTACNEVPALFLIASWADTGGGSDQNMGAIIEYNVFDNCTGNRNEGIIFKVSGNTFRYNVIIDSDPLSLRIGDDNLVFNNWFFGSSAFGIGGVVVKGADHEIINNYIDSLTAGSKYKGNITLAGGQEPGDDVELVENLLAESNTIISKDETFRWHTGQQDTSTIKNNILISTEPIGIAFTTSPVPTITWVDNLAYNTGAYFSSSPGVPTGDWPTDSESTVERLNSGEYALLFTFRTDPEWGEIKILKDDPGNLALDNSTRNETYPLDIDKQTRPADNGGQKTDTGADQQSTAILTYRPIPSSRVGPTWYAGYDDNPPVSSSPKPDGSPEACSEDPQPFSLQATTDEPSTCQYCKDGDGGCDSASVYDGDTMVDMSSTGNLTTHTQAISEACSQNNVTYWTICKDFWDQEQTAPTQHIFSIGSGTPAPPSIGGSGLIRLGSGAVNMSVGTVVSGVDIGIIDLM